MRTKYWPDLKQFTRSVTQNNSLLNLLFILYDKVKLKGTAHTLKLRYTLISLTKTKWYFGEVSRYIHVLTIAG